MLQLLQLLQHAFDGGFEGVICRNFTIFFNFVTFTAHFMSAMAAMLSSPKVRFVSEMSSVSSVSVLSVGKFGTIDFGNGKRQSLVDSRQSSVQCKNRCESPRSQGIQRTPIVDRVFICSGGRMIRCCNVCCKRQSLVYSRQSLVQGKGECKSPRYHSKSTIGGTSGTTSHQSSVISFQVTVKGKNKSLDNS